MTSEMRTLPAQLRENAREQGQRPAIREKEFGIWQSVTWQGYYDRVRWLALGLRDLGVRPGDKVAIIGDNRPEWVYAELATQSLGGAAVGVFPDSHLDQVRHIVNHSDSSVVVLEDQEQCDKILDLGDDVALVGRVLVDDMKGLRHYQDPRITPFVDVVARGQEIDRARPELFDELVDQVRPEDVAIIAYTSGTTGVPKGAMLSHRNMLSMARNYDSIDPAYPTDNHVSFLPLPWVGEQMTGVSWHLTKGFTINFPESVFTVQENIREIGPHIMFAPPRIWEKMCSDVQVRIQDAFIFKRWFYKWFMPVGYRMAEAKLAKKRPSAVIRLQAWLGHWLLFRALNNFLGLARVRNAYTGGAALGPEIFNLFTALGVNIKQLYGQTEIAGISVGHRNDDIKLDTVGQPIPGVELKISDTGEILSRGPSVFLGYYKNEDATAETLRDGWLYSGDAGLIDEDGHLIMIDRMDDVMLLTDGSKFSPQLIENKLKFSPYITEAVVVGQDRPFVAAMINMDMANMGKWAENRQLTFTTFTDLSQREEVYDLIAAEVAKTNAGLPKVARVSRFVMLYKELDADDEELTRTRKVRRRFVAQRYEVLIEALYGDKDVFEIEADVQYQDGKSFVMKTLVRVKDVPEPPE
ncbi:MAG: AMP-binding protein [Proteobacteria bacterium]|nr:AMP-binding protein [Pseudomonadota bacterium]